MGLSEGSSEKIKSYRVCKRFVGNGEGSEFGRELWPKRIFFFFLHLCNFPDRQGPVNKAGHRVEPGSHHTAPGISFGLHSLKCSQQVTSCFILPIATIFFFLLLSSFWAAATSLCLKTQPHRSVWLISSPLPSFHLQCFLLCIWHLHFFQMCAIVLILFYNTNCRTLSVLLCLVSII